MIANGGQAFAVTEVMDPGGAMDNEQKQGAASRDGWVPHEWSQEEVAEAVAYLKERNPQDWAELEHLEKTTGDLSESSAPGIELAALMIKYEKAFDHRDVIQLQWRVRIARREMLGLD
ncbi:hypothetical protein KDH83_08565 [Achromobacter sp. Marseille-Q0513]|uniref:hypothetical protein n=1 Tax=Achromobacter sp. Marseille-Q0513 TaxID=2829161 RepID=UPI001B938CEA|nr:hypothetical protein [Achromobacter sp. Marseille-Q0513]MBR8653356.1 hypothetical protein [Achromobacter sp. Marseille-Q0513]